MSPKSAKYDNLSSTHIFLPLVIGTLGTWKAQAIDLTQKKAEIGRRISAFMGDPQNHLPLSTSLRHHPVIFCLLKFVLSFFLHFQHISLHYVQ